MKTLRHFSALLLLFAVSVVCMACYSSKDLKAGCKRVTVTRNVGYFSKVDASGSVDIVFAQGKEKPMRIEGPKQFVDNIVVEKKGDRLCVLVRLSLALLCATPSTSRCVVRAT